MLKRQVFSPNMNPGLVVKKTLPGQGSMKSIQPILCKGYPVDQWGTGVQTMKIEIPSQANMIIGVSWAKASTGLEGAPDGVFTMKYGNMNWIERCQNSVYQSTDQNPWVPIQIPLRGTSNSLDLEVLVLTAMTKISYFQIWYI